MGLRRRFAILSIAVCDMQNMTIIYISELDWFYMRINIWAKQNKWEKFIGKRHIIFISSNK